MTAALTEQERELLIRECARIEVDLSPTQVEQLSAFCDRLATVNEQMNLTSIPREQYVEKHLLDSLLAAPLIRGGKVQQVIDVGTGAGLPGIPLAIFFPEIHFVLVDGTAKRLRFIDEVIVQLQIGNARTVHARGEQLGQSAQFREQFDVAIARAVADLAPLSEFLLPLVKPGGCMIALKGPRVAEEVAGARQIITALGGVTPELRHYELPISHESRTFAIVRKTKPTPPQYPRRQVPRPEKRS